MRLTSSIEFYVYKDEYDAVNDKNVETKHMVGRKQATVEEMSGTQYYRAFGTFKRNNIRVSVLHQPKGFTHIKYNNKFYTVVDSSKIKNRVIYVAEEV